MRSSNGTYAFNGFFNERIVCGFTDRTVKGVMPDVMMPVIKDLGLRSGICFMNQLHGGVVHEVTGSGVYDGDGLVTELPGLALVVKTADCMPLLFASESHGAIAAAHMGWRSAKAGILGNINRDLSDFKVLIGVGMRKCCYEVGREFSGYEEFKGHVIEKNGRLFFDPVSFIREKCAARGMLENNILDTGLCSVCMSDRYFSFRKGDKNDRTLTFIAQKDPVA